VHPSGLAHVAVVEGSWVRAQRGRARILPNVPGIALCRRRSIPVDGSAAAIPTTGDQLDVPGQPHHQHQNEIITRRGRPGHGMRQPHAKELRKDMVCRFGLEPSPKLHHYYRAVLTFDPELDEMPVLPLPTQLPELLVLPP
jgi:hypothetical protein